MSARARALLLRRPSQKVVENKDQQRGGEQAKGDTGCGHDGTYCTASERGRCRYNGDMSAEHDLRVHVAAHLPEVTAIRHDLHAHPELSGSEERTARVVA